jgi:type II secretory pathway component PulF
MDEYQWLLLGQLLKRYDSLLTALDLLEGMYPDNRRIITLQQQLRNGRQLKEILKADRFERALRFYVDYLDLASAIEIVHRRNAQINELRKQTVSRVSYQLLLFGCAMVILSVFSDYVLPNMTFVLQLGGPRLEDITMLFRVIVILRNILAVGVVLLVGCFWYILKRHRQNYLWMTLHRLGHDKFIRALASYQFAGELHLLMAASIPLPDALEILRFQRSDSFTSLLAYHFNDSLTNGQPLSESLKSEYFDEQFTAIALYGLQEDDFLKSLADYRSVMERRLERLLKKLTAILSVLCYGFVLVIIILAYQVLLLPLELLEDL